MTNMSGQQTSLFVIPAAIDAAWIPALAGMTVTA